MAKGEDIPKKINEAYRLINKPDAYTSENSSQIRAFIQSLTKELKACLEEQSLVDKGQERMYKALRESEEMYRTLANAAPNMILVYRNNRLLYANPAAESITGYTKEELLMIDFIDLISPDYQDVIKEGIKARMGGYRELRYYEAKIIKKTGEGRWLSISANLIAYAGSQAGIATCMDITDRKLVEMELQKSKKNLEIEVHNRTAELLRAQEFAEAALHVKSDFLAVMNHELRTPLNGILGVASLLAVERLSNDQREYIDIIRRSGESLLTVINDILNFIEIDSEKASMREEPFNLRRCIKAAVTLSSSKAMAKGLDIACSIDRNVPETIISNELSIRQVLLSLLDNAIKFTNRGGIDIIISCRDLENGKQEILFAIKDTGNGIFENEIKKLFQPFSQVDMSITRKYGGIGLGLAASKQLVELMGGKIWVESEPGRGSTFYFNVVTDQPYGMPSGNSGPV